MKTKCVCISILLFIISSGIVKADTICSKADTLIFRDYINQFTTPAANTSGLIINTAKFFLGKPYVASTLEVGNNENLIVNLRELDCTTLVENCIALSQVVKSGDYSFDNYCKQLSAIRYRNGVIDGYPSRLHYLSDWIYENEKRGIFKNVSLEMRGKKIVKPLNFMSTHPQSYKHLKDNSENIRKVKEIENLINKRSEYVVISKPDIPSIEKDIKDGDIIAFATTIAGLDYSHIGIAYRTSGQLKFIHASSRAKKVVIENENLLNYCNKSKTCSGITVIRIEDK